MQPDEWDVFICHASDDKDALVRPLAEALRDLGVRVWYDEFSLRPGDSLRRSIQAGLMACRFGLVVISPTFFGRGWTEYELDGLTAMDVDGATRIIPVWYGVSREQVLQYSPSLADRKAIVCEENSHPVTIAVEVTDVVRPDLFQGVVRRSAFLTAAQAGDGTLTPVSALRTGPIRHSRLPRGFVNRVRVLRAALERGYPLPLDKWLDALKRDLYPQDELAWWEHLTACYLEYLSRHAPEEVDHTVLFSAVFRLLTAADSEFHAVCRELEQAGFSDLIDVLDEGVQLLQRENGGP